MQYIIDCKISLRSFNNTSLAHHGPNMCSEGLFGKGVILFKYWENLEIWGLEWELLTSEESHSHQILKGRIYVFLESGGNLLSF